MPFHTGFLGKYDKRYYEVYISPDRSDVEELAKQTEHPGKCRVLLTPEGELYAFTIELLHDLAVAELDEEGISVVCFFAENKLEVADLGNLELDEMKAAVKEAEAAFRKMGFGEDTKVRFVLNQGLWGDETLDFHEVVKGDWKKVRT
ncbi:hypothetical protein CIG75_15170 [Tumebacillus algifaecis]|uniref:Uncharacterized protein n=1 Tax=Tumebacillus algifaecis TaxID=1214604 RepID=A0A223D3J8_9BACL|nr:hypothetical protein [Tumebacillus algifaecis]ASS76151.1 hypothetical protein CIG75_15170 [Tumebacillus algifaecis]